MFCVIIPFLRGVIPSSFFFFLLMYFIFAFFFFFLLSSCVCFPFICWYLCIFYCFFVMVFLTCCIRCARCSGQRGRLVPASTPMIVAVASVFGPCCAPEALHGVIMSKRHMKSIFPSIVLM